MLALTVTTECGANSFALRQWDSHAPTTKSRPVAATAVCPPGEARPSWFRVALRGFVGHRGRTRAAARNEAGLTSTWPYLAPAHGPERLLGRAAKSRRGRITFRDWRGPWNRFGEWPGTRRTRPSLGLKRTPPAHGGWVSIGLRIWSGWIGLWMGTHEGGRRRLGMRPDGGWDPSLRVRCGDLTTRCCWGPCPTASQATRMLISLDAKLPAKPLYGLVEFRPVLMGVMLGGDTVRRLAQEVFAEPPVC